MNSELQDFISECNPSSGYSKNVLKYFLKHVNQPVSSDRLKYIPGKNGKTLNHNIRRLFEIRDELGYDLINWQSDSRAKEKKLKYGEWMLCSETPKKKSVERTASKKVIAETFQRDNYTCQACGAIASNLHHIYNSPVKLHWGHKQNFVANRKQTYTIDDGITLCSYCNEGAKNNIDFNNINLHRFCIEHVSICKKINYGILKHS